MWFIITYFLIGVVFAAIICDMASRAYYFVQPTVIIFLCLTVLWPYYGARFLWRIYNG